MVYPFSSESQTPAVRGGLRRDRGDLLTLQPGLERRALSNPSGSWDYQPPPDPLLDDVSAAFTGEPVPLGMYHQPPNAAIPCPFV